MSLRNNYVVDTNVPIVANKATQLDTDIPHECISACVRHIKQIIKNGGLVLDSGGEILKEYRGHLSMRGQPGLGDVFAKWVWDHQYLENKVTRIEIHKQRDSYKEFPQHPKLKKVDPDDHKFVAVANAHPDKPAILQATDSKWWGWKDALKEKGITVDFLCPKYIETIFKKKMTK